MSKLHEKALFAWVWEWPFLNPGSLSVCSNFILRVENEPFSSPKTKFEHILIYY